MALPSLLEIRSFCRTDRLRHRRPGDIPKLDGWVHCPTLLAGATRHISIKSLSRLPVLPRDRPFIGTMIATSVPSGTGSGFAKIMVFPCVFPLYSIGVLPFLTTWVKKRVPLTALSPPASPSYQTLQ